MKAEKETMVREIAEELRKLEVQDLVLILNSVNILNDRMSLERNFTQQESA